jgi:hypothetical protein
VKRTLLFVCLLVFCNLTLLGQTGRSPRIVHTKEKSAIHVPPQEAPLGLKKIFSNLGSSKIDLYNDLWSFGLAGPNAYGTHDFVGMRFTPKSDSHVVRVEVALNYFKGDNQINLSIYGDSSGVPGILLAGPVTVTNLPTGGTCCALTIADFSPVAVTGGTPYWVVADTALSGTGSDFWGGWSFVVQGKTPFLATSTIGGWLQIPGLALPAGEVLGTIP